ncbi:MAG: hypothetical protein JRC53_03915 [Deltaproteobacteria bacterium]|nr:hypothetical protein [Deltaproteobacteria bacterium]
MKLKTRYGKCTDGKIWYEVRVVSGSAIVNRVEDLLEAWRKLQVPGDEVIEI